MLEDYWRQLIILVYTILTLYIKYWQILKFCIAAMTLIYINFNWLIILLNCQIQYAGIHNIIILTNKCIYKWVIWNHNITTCIVLHELHDEQYLSIMLQEINLTWNANTLLLTNKLWPKYWQILKILTNKRVLIEHDLKPTGF